MIVFIGTDIRSWFTKYNYKEVSVYFNADEKLMGVPCGKSSKYDIAQLDFLFQLEPGYSDDALEVFIEKLFNACYSKKCIDDGKTAIEKYTNAKSYYSAVKNLKLIIINWSKADGYTFMPTKAGKKYKGAFEHMTQDKIFVPCSCEKGDLAKSFRQTMKISQ
jgi:hypothetical protein